MLTYDFKKRITAEECLNHPWFKRHALPTLDNELTNAHLKNLKLFRVRASILSKFLGWIKTSGSSFDIYSFLIIIKTRGRRV